MLYLPRKILILCSAALLLCTHCRAQEINTAAPHREILYEHREISKEQWDELSKDPSFQYNFPEEAQVSGNQMEWWFKLWKNIYSFFSSTGGKILIWAVVILLGGLLIFKVLQLRHRIFFSRSDKKLAETGKEMPQENLSTDWQKALEEALQKKDYRLAVRYAYNQLLHTLHEKNRIIYEKGKTNHNYSQELLGSDLYKPFLRTTLQYEYIWYGAFEIGKPQFEHYYQNVNQIKSAL